MDKSFVVLQISSGWFMGEIKNNQNSLFFDASYITNFPDDFMKALLFALGRWPQDEKRVSSFTVDSEPVITEWNITVVEERFVFRTSTYNPDRPREGRTDRVLRLPVKLFLQDFLSEFNSVLNRFGLYGYRSEWGYEFPLSLFFQLADIYNDRSSLIPIEGDETENSGLSYDSVDLKKELGYLDCN